MKQPCTLLSLLVAVSMFNNMTYIQFVVLAVLAVAGEGTHLTCDRANCSCEIIEDGIEMACNGLNMSVTANYITRVTLTCDEPITSMSTMPSMRLGDIFQLKLDGCISTVIPMRSILDRLGIDGVILLGVTGEVVTLPRGHLANLSGVKEVTMESLHLAHIDPHVFGDESYPDVNITGLYMKYNNISELDYRVFSKLSQLEELSLTFNKLHDLPDDLLLHNVKLAKLYLSYNQLEGISSKLFRNQGSLKRLYLNNNCITNLSGEWRGLDSLTKLDLTHNQLTSLDASVFRHLYNLAELDLDKNLLTSLGESVFGNLHNLQELDLSKNQLTSLGEEEESIFRNLHNLRELDLSSNQLTQLYSDWVRLPNIQKIDLFDNSIQTIRVETLAESNHSMRIILLGNNITEVNLDGQQNGGANDTTKPVVTVQLEENPFNCDCHLLPFAKVIQGDLFISFTNVRVKVHSCNFLSCGSPPSLEHHSIVYLALEDLNCSISDEEYVAETPNRKILLA